MRLNNAVILVFFINFYTLANCWQFFTSFSDLVMSNSYPDQMWLNSEYKFGNCSSKQVFYTHVKLNGIEILGKIIVRGWIDVIRIPTCIILRGKSWSEHMIRSSALNFQMCVPRISYCHTHRRFKYYFYEWYIPENYEGGMDWELYFFGPPNATW